MFIKKVGIIIPAVILCVLSLVAALVIIAIIVSLIVISINNPGKYSFVHYIPYVVICMAIFGGGLYAVFLVTLLIEKYRGLSK